MSDDQRIEEYFRIYGPAERARLLEEMEKEQPDARHEALRRLFAHRYQVKKGTADGYADRYLMAIVSILQMMDNGVRVNARTLSDVRAHLAVLLPEGEQEQLREAEVKNAIGRYIETCHSPDYKKKYFGLVALKEEERKHHIRRDVYAMSHGVAEYFSLQKECEVLIRAAEAAYAAHAPGEAPLSGP